MMANNGARLGVHGLHVVHQLTPIAVATETIDCNDIASNGNHVCLPLIINRHFSKAFLKSATEGPVCLISDET